MAEILTLWIFTHAIADLFSEKAKPFSCQLCLSGWLCISISIISKILGDGLGLTPYVWWAASVFLEAIYQRLRMMII